MVNTGILLFLLALNSNSMSYSEAKNKYERI